MNAPFIMVIEDNPAEVDLLRIALDEQKTPYDLFVLSDGAEALQFIKGRHPEGKEPQPCAMLLDVHLPKYDGLEVLAAVKGEPRLGHIPVVMLSSAAVRAEEEAKIRNLGGVFRQKPASFPEVLQLAADILALCNDSFSYV